jgi:hypothetical protein
MKNHREETGEGKAPRKFKVISTTKVCNEPFVDWYEAETPEEALELALEDAHRYQLPKDTQFEVIEVTKDN